MNSVQTGTLGELILCEPLCLPNLLYPLADNAMNVLQTLRLWVYAAYKHPALKQHLSESRRQCPRRMICGSPYAIALGILWSWIIGIGEQDANGMRIILAVALQALAAVMLFEAGGHHRYGYYRNLRLVVTAACLCTVYLLLNASLKHVRHAAWIFGAGAFLFNPIIPFYLKRSDWERIDATVGALMVIGALTVAGDALWSGRRRQDCASSGAPRNG